MKKLAVLILVLFAALAVYFWLRETPKDVTVEDPVESTRQIVSAATDNIIQTKQQAVSKGIASAKSAPKPSDSTSAQIVDYRSVPLPAKDKGGYAGELREWILKDSSGLLTHREEEWIPNDVGELKCEKTVEYAADRVLVTTDGETEVVQFGTNTELMEIGKGCKIHSVVSNERVGLDTVADLMMSLQDQNGKLIVEPDYIQSAFRTPDDSRYRGLWGMEKINAPQAWDMGVDATNVVVAVLDTGVNYFHEDLTDNIIRDRESLAFPYVKGYNAILNNMEPMDDNGHGSHCAGTIAAVGNNGKGVTGVSWNANIMPLKALNWEGKGSVSAIIACMNWSRAHGADIISCSFGGYCGTQAQWLAMERLRIMGAMFACAAGNEGKDGDKYPMYPASYDLENIVSVASSGMTDELSGFSNYGLQNVDIAAPGEGILSTCWSYRSADTCYETMSGTSMACPHVAGAMALLKGYYPDDEPFQTIQRLLLNGQDVEALKGKIKTGKRLDLYGAMLSTIPPAPVVKATEGTLEDRVEINWKPVKGATYYKLYRMWSEGGPKTELTGWTTDLSYVDYKIEPRVGYHYYVQCSKHEDGHDASPLSSAAVGYMKRPVIDEWDNDDDQPMMATVIIPTDQEQSHGEHTLSEKDAEDWFKVTMSKNYTYVFESKGQGDLFAELFNSPTTNRADRVDYDDDSGTNLNFKVAFTPTSSGEYYLRVTNRGDHDAYYNLKYIIADWADEWDPTDDTFAGATPIEISMSETKHGLHALSAYDRQDVFKFELLAGHSYSFKSTGDGDTYGELYRDNSARGNLVAFNDDGHDAASGSRLNFRILYTPEVSGTYYLKVRTARERESLTYQLVCNEYITEYAFEFTDDDLCSSVKGWAKNAILSADAEATEGCCDFAAGTPIFLKWAFNEVDFKRVEEPVNNLVEVYNSFGERILWGDAIWNGAIQSGAFIDFKTGIPALPAGAYVIRLTLDKDHDGAKMSIPFTMVESDEAVKSLEIIGPDSVASKGSAHYRAVATFANGIVGDVSPAWSLVDGGDYASISPEGELTVVLVTQERQLRLRAVYGERLVETSVTIRAEAPEISSPFGSSVRYPNVAMKVSAIVKIDGVVAEEGDYLAAYVGNELRGTAKIGADGVATISVSLGQNEERVHFKVCDVSVGEEGAILSCAETLAGVIGGEVGPIELTATTDDPFGTPEAPGSSEEGAEEPKGKAKIHAQVTINGWPAAPGDMLAIYDGDRLAGKGRISLLASVIGLFKGAAGCTVEVELVGKRELSFLVWDASRRKMCSTSTTLTLKPGETAGSALKPIKVEVDDRTKVDLWFPIAGWHLISTGLNLDEPKASAVFASQSEVFEEVKNQTESWKPEEESELELSPTKGYWVKTTEDEAGVTISGERPENLKIPLQVGWNLIGYPFERAGRIEDVLRTALENGTIISVADDTGTYPNGNLTMMEPGKGYWVQSTRTAEIVFDDLGLTTAGRVLGSYGPFGDGSDVVKIPTVPARFVELRLKLGESTASFGDVVAFYGEDERLYALARVDDESGHVAFPVYASEGMKLIAKLWNVDSGVENPQIFTSTTKLTVPAAGVEVEGAQLCFAIGASEGGSADGEPCKYSVKFVLGDYLTRTGGGVVEQQIELGKSAESPKVDADDGWEFLGWDAPFGDVRRDLVIYARVAEKKSPPYTPPIDPETLPHYTVHYESNGGLGEMLDESIVVGESPAKTESLFSRDGYEFLGWSTRIDGGTRIPSWTQVSADETVNLYAQWGYSGFKVSAKTLVCNEDRTVTVPIAFDSAIPISMIAVQVAYDPEIVEIRKVEPGTLSRVLADDFTASEPKHGLISIALFAAEDTVPGRGTVAELTFTVRRGASGHFSDISIANAQVGDISGVKDLTVEHPIEVESGMIRVMAASSDVSRLEGAEMIAAGTTLAELTLSSGDTIQAADFGVPVCVSGSVLSECAELSIEAPATGWGKGEYQLLKTRDDGLNLKLVNCSSAWTIRSESADGWTTYYAAVESDENLEIIGGSGESLSVATCNQIRSLIKGALPQKVTKLTVYGPKDLIPLIVDMGIAPELSIVGTEANAVYRTPILRIVAFDPQSGIVRVKVTPGEGNQIVGYLSTGYVHVYGSENLNERMSRLSTIECDLSPYLEQQTLGEADLVVELGSHSFIKVKIE